MRQMLHVPPNPCGQGAILVVLIHSGEMTPLRVTAQKLRHARFEIDTKPLPLQEEETYTRRRMRCTQTWVQTWRRKKQGDESGFQQHPVGLIAREILCC